MSNTHLGGWGRGTWNQSAWNTPLSVLVTGVAGTSALGSETVTGGATASVTGVVGTGNIGVSLVWGDIDTSQVPNWQIVNTS